MFYASGEEKTKEDYEILQQEIEAYRTLDGQSFKFGNELIINDDEFHYGSEDGYLGMDAQDLRDILEYWYEDKTEKRKRNKKKRLNKYERKKITQQKYRKLSQIRWWTVHYKENENRYIKIYYSGTRKYAKYCTNKKIRNSNNFPLKGGGYKKVFDYWWTIF